MKGDILKGLAVLGVTFIVSYIVQNMVEQPTGGVITAAMLKGGQAPTGIFVLHTLISATISVLLAPILSIVTILLYYDIRIRKEGLDLELLANELHAKSQQAPAWAPQPLPEEQVTMELPQEQIATPPQQEQTPPEQNTNG
jgi:hypothetical protein